MQSVQTAVRIKICGVLPMGDFLYQAINFTMNSNMYHNNLYK